MNRHSSLSWINQMDQKTFVKKCLNCLKCIRLQTLSAEWQVMICILLTPIFGTFLWNMPFSYTVTGITWTEIHNRACQIAFIRGLWVFFIIDLLSYKLIKGLIWKITCEVDLKELSWRIYLTWYSVFFQVRTLFRVELLKNFRTVFVGQEKSMSLQINFFIWII